MKKLIKLLAILAGNCPAGGDHQRGTSGEWLVRCVKCGAPC
ncbi:hypothetical protein SEA_HENOCCUS_11 [Streptomyces phage Henoccus]|nr:hypothetical protein SEA_HENOCCUS_11 [Streptomyces phage Henoccus]AWY07401.1 hypothetical protein SEA_JACKIEB_10 [Streptomyces phage JackieB]